MVTKEYAIGLKETLHYLKGIQKEDIDKIPLEFIEYMKQNADKNYECNFDYTKPLGELELKDETYGIISMICLNYWCENQEEKTEYIQLLENSENEYKKELEQKYTYYDTNDNISKIFEERQKQSNPKETEDKSLIEYKKSKWYEKIFAKIKKIIKK